MTTRYIASKVLYALAAVCFLLAVFSVSVGTVPLLTMGWLLLAIGFLVA
jgi:hypothetical protein